MQHSNTHTHTAQYTRKY